MIRKAHIGSTSLRIAGLAVAIGLGASAQADIVSGTVTAGSSFDNGGMFLEIPPPAVLTGNLYQDDNVRAFNEQQDVTLTDNLLLNVTSDSVGSNVIGPGSIVSSHYIIYDPSVTSTVEGSVTFDEPVLGAIIYNGQFNATDTLLGSTTTSYAIGSQQLESPDTVTITGSTVSFFIQAVSPGDAIRVITGVDPELGVNVCEEGTATLTGAITGGDALAFGGSFRQICDPIGPVGANNFESYDLFAFEEQQAVELVTPLTISDTEIIAAGETVSSFYVVWDPAVNATVLGTVTFPDDIIAVIQTQGRLQDSEFLGNASASYLNPSQLGLENNDSVSFVGNELTVDLVASSPGDSVRVILGSASPSLSINPCLPEDFTISGTITGGSAFVAGGVFTQLCDPVGPVGNDNFQSNDLFAFEELRDQTLDADLTLEDDVVVPAGTQVNSYYIAFDPSTSRSIIGDLNMPEPILGIATSLSTLNDSDFLGNPTANYLNPSLRGLEAQDSVTFAGNIVSVSFDASSPGDYIRVITAVVVDSDGDGVSDEVDNCTLAANPGQEDTDADGYGNACDADFNNDCIVNFLDISLFPSEFLSTTPLFDLNGDGVVNFFDYILVTSQFQQPPGPGLAGGVCD